jgi:hypothetical protein
VAAPTSKIAVTRCRFANMFPSERAGSPATG